MGLEVYWLQLAEDKLDDIYYYYRIKAGKRIAQKLINGIIDVTIGLDKQPEIGQTQISLTKRKITISIFNFQKLQNCILDKL